LAAAGKKIITSTCRDELARPDTTDAGPLVQFTPRRDLCGWLYILFSLVGVFTYITFYLADPPFRLSTEALSYLFVVYLVGLVVTPAAGYFISHVGLRVGIAGSIGLSLLGVVMTLAHSLTLVIAGLALVCTGVFISQASATSYLREAAPAGGRVSAAGLYISCYYVGGTVAGVVPSYLWAFGKWPACVAFIAVMQVVTLAIALVGWRPSAN
jgi:MFS family permease